MIAIIVMIMIFLSFSIVVSYNLMSVNHNLVISADIEQMGLCCLIQRKGIPAHNASFLNNILSFRHT
ncbi:hypothetical protein ACXZ7Q_19975, partial [Vibrio campbellii]